MTCEGGSGSFLIFWSDLWKLNTAATIPYYTGQYGNSPRGFGFVAIGAQVEDFHRPANQTREEIDAFISLTDGELNAMAADTQNSITSNLVETAKRLSASTAVMIILVIMVAIWLASIFTRSITRLIDGISRFRRGERQFRFDAPIKDEIGALSDAFDDMADSLVDSVRTPMVITDLARNIIFMNQSGLDSIGKSLDDVVGRPFEEHCVYPPGSDADPVLAYREGREAEPFFFPHVGRYYVAKADDFLDKEGRAVGYMITTSDVTDIITEKKTTEEQRALLNTIFTSSPDLMWYKDAQGRFLALNPRYASVLGKTPEQLLLADADSLFPPDLAREYKAYDDEAKRAGKPLYTVQSVTFADGHVEMLDTVRTPLFKGGEFSGILGVARDVSRRVEAENELRLTQEELEKVARDANAANEAKSAFLARMSHEIRTPMNAIIGMTSITKRKLFDRTAGSDELMKHITQIEISAQHLLGLLNDILDISKIEAGKIELSHEPLELTKLLNSVADIIRPRCQEKNIQFRVNKEKLPTDFFVSDVLRLRQVLINLLGNAVKFTPECGNITFSVTQLADERDRTLLNFSVADNGIGISVEAREHLFKPFEQANAQISRQYGGTGLGLSISRSIIRMLGGDIAVVSEENKGSTFHFSIWLEKGECAIVPEERLDGELSLRGKRALLVDDVDINRIIVTELLGETGLVMDEAEDGREAVHMFASSPEFYYDIIFMDIQMPQMDGYEATHLIRTMERADAETVPIIAMTANAFQEDVEKTLGNGMNAHLPKPLEPEKMLDMIYRFLEK